MAMTREGDHVDIVLFSVVPKTTHTGTSLRRTKGVTKELDRRGARELNQLQNRSLKYLEKSPRSSTSRRTTQAATVLLRSRSYSPRTAVTQDKVNEIGAEGAVVLGSKQWWEDEVKDEISRVIVI